MTVRHDLDLIIRCHLVLILLDLAEYSVFELVMTAPMLPSLLQYDLEYGIVQKALRLGPHCIEHPLILILLYQVLHLGSTYLELETLT